MATLRCKKCGGNLNIIDTESSLCECEYCGSKETIPTIDNEKIMKLYDRANRLRMANEFDKAASVYESIVEESDTEAEAYWGLVLCKYGIEYVDDPASGDKIPTCHRLSFDSVMEDSDFELVMENADMMSRNVYRDNAKQIEDIRRGIIEVSDKEEPYDIFICYKETDENGDRTIDSVMAQNVYDALTTKGYRVFFSRITLEDKLGQEYEPYIFAALNSAKIMLAFGTNYDYYHAIWVKNEWSRYLKIMAKDKSKKLIPCYKGIDAYDIPKEFKHLQAQDMGKVGADQDLIRGIDKILRPEGSGNGASANASDSHVQDIQAVVASAVAANTGSNMNALLERGFMTLEDGDFDKADSLFEDVLNQNPKCAEAYMGKLLAYYKMTNVGKFAQSIYKTFFSENTNDQKKSTSCVVCGALLYGEVEKCPICASVIKKSNLPVVNLELDYDICDILKQNFVLADDIIPSRMQQIKEIFSSIKIESKSSILAKYNDSMDYILKYCELDNDGENNSTQDDKYYQRYLQYADEKTKERFDIQGIIANLINEEKKKIDLKSGICSKENMIKLIEQVNKDVETEVGDDFDEIQKEYKKAIEAWEKEEQLKEEQWIQECRKIKEEWLVKRVQIQQNWKDECDEIKKQYEKEKRIVDENNNKVQGAYKEAIASYESEIARFESQISELESQLRSLTGFFKGKQRDEISKNIILLQNQKELLTKPCLAQFGKVMLEPTLNLPKQPKDSEKPVMPNKPEKQSRPKRKLTKKIDVIDVLSKFFEELGLNYGETQYEEATALMNTPVLYTVTEAEKIFDNIIFYKDSKRKKMECKRLIQSGNLKEMTQRQYQNVYIIAPAILDYLSTVDKSTATMVAQSIKVDFEMTTSRAVDVLKMLEREGKVKKFVKERVGYYSLI